MKNIGRFKIYGKLYNFDELEERYDEDGLPPLMNNGIQGYESLEFILELNKQSSVKDLFVDIEGLRDGGDTLFIQFVSDELIDIDNYNTVMKIVFDSNPDEFTFSKDDNGNNILRIWWD